MQEEFEKLMIEATPSEVLAFGFTYAGSFEGAELFNQLCEKYGLLKK